MSVRFVVPADVCTIPFTLAANASRLGLQAEKHVGTFVAPQAHAMLHGNISSFLENFADEKKRTRTAQYKNYWLMKSDGQWKHPDTLIAAAGKGSWSARKIGDDGVELTSCGTKIGPDKYVFPVTMPAVPNIIKKPVVYALGAYYDKTNSKIYVNWTLTRSNTPQLSYEVALFDNEACSGTPLAATSGTDPEVTMAALRVKNINLKAQNYYVTVRIIDIFNQTSPVKEATLHDLKP